MPSPSPIEEKVWIAIRDLLLAAKVNGQQMDYVKGIFEGVRELPNGAFPAVILEPDETEETLHTVAGASSKYRLVQRISIHCMIEHLELDHQIIGDGAAIQGIYDLVSDVKNVLQTPAKLGLDGENVLWVRFPNTRYFFDNFPIREAVITAEIESTRRKTNR